MRLLITSPKARTFLTFITQLMIFYFSGLILYFRSRLPSSSPNINCPTKIILRPKMKSNTGCITDRGRFITTRRMYIFCSLYSWIFFSSPDIFFSITLSEDPIQSNSWSHDGALQRLRDRGRGGALTAKNCSRKHRGFFAMQPYTTVRNVMSELFGSRV